MVLIGEIGIKGKKIIFAFIAGLLLLVILFSGILSERNWDTLVFKGNYAFTGADDYANAYAYEALLAGEWEYYPDVLLYSEPPEQIPAPEYVKIPDRWIGKDAALIPESGNATYLIHISGYSEVVGHSNIVLSMQGFLQDYKIYLNGRRLDVRIPSPTGYPVYAITGSGDMELAIELRNCTTGLTLVPDLWAIGVHIGNMDSTRNFLFIIITLFLILFVMFLVFSFASHSHALRPLVILGFGLTVLFLLNTFWASGYLDAVNQLIPNDVLYMAIIILRIAVFEFLIIVFRKYYPQVFSGKMSILCECCLAAGFLVWIILVVFLHLQAGWIMHYVLTGITPFIWIFTLLRKNGLAYEGCFLNSLMAIVVVTSIAISVLHDWFPDNQYLMFSLPAAVIMVICVCFARYYAHQQAALKRTQELLEIEKYAARTQTALLSSQIQPHFLYNTLLTIQELCRFDPAEASRVIVRFSDYLRHNIDFMNYSELIPFESEEKHIDNFIYIQEARFQDKLSYTADISTRDFMIPPLTLQPLIENAIKYGVRGKLEGGFVHVSVYEDRAGVHMIVRNSGPGFDEDKIRTDHSLGNIRSRLKTLINAALTISSQEGKEGTVVEILIPSNEIRRVGTMEKEGRI